MQFVVFEKFTSACDIKLQEKSCKYLLIMYTKKHQSQNGPNFEACARDLQFALFYNFALVWHENALVFSQSEARNVFMYIFTLVTFIIIGKDDG